jgi:HEAT repeat protein
MKTNSDDRHFEVPHATIDELKKIGGDAAIAGLSQALDQGDPQFRQQAVDALAEIGGEAAIAPLVKALKHDKVYHVCKQAASALGQIGSEAAIAGLRKALDDPNHEIRMAVTRILKRTSSETEQL